MASRGKKKKKVLDFSAYPEIKKVCFVQRRSDQITSKMIRVILTSGYDSLIVVNLQYHKITATTADRLYQCRENPGGCGCEIISHQDIVARCYIKEKKISNLNYVKLAFQCFCQYIL